MSVSITTMCSPAKRRVSHVGKRARRLGAQRVGQHRQELAHRRGLVVDHVVEAGLAALDRGHGGRGGVVDVDQRPHAPAVADDRELALEHRLGLGAVGGRSRCRGRRSRRSGARSRRPRSPRSSRCLMAARMSRIAGGGSSSSGRVLVLDRAALAREGPAGEALRHHPRADGLPRPRAGGRCPRCAAGWWARTPRPSCAGCRCPRGRWPGGRRRPAGPPSRPRARRRGPARRGRPPRRRRRAAGSSLASVVVVPVTSWPSATSIGTRLLPMAPVAPVMKTLMPSETRRAPET